MTIAEYSIKNKVISWMFLVILAVGGVVSFGELGRLEDPPFTVKDAMVITSYPGATSTEVEEELTYPLEKAIRQLPYIDKITSTSSAGLSQIMVSMKMDYGSDELPQIWDELRRKVNDLEPSLPPGVNPVQVMDDFGDVYGVMLMITGDNYSYVELKRYVDYLTRELELVEGIGKISLAGDQNEQLYVEMSLKRVSALNLDMTTIAGLLTQQNAVISAGEVTLNSQTLKLRPSGELNSIETFENLIIHGRDTGNLIRLKDVATVSRDVQEVPSNLLNYNGQPALNLGIAFSKGVNVVKVGEALDVRLAELENIKPAGVQIHTLYNQAKEVDQSVSGFVLSLAQAVGIVIVVLLFTMGLRSGVIIGAVLLLTVLGTFILMSIYDVELHRISLGALIIALGMLVDNAIVVVEGILVGLQRGRTKVQAAVDIVEQTKWPLLGATVIAIIAFAPIGLSPDATGEFMGSLFWVLCFSLFLSWVTAITLTPFLANLLLSSKTGEQEQSNEDPYKGLLFVVFGRLLKFCLRFRMLTIVLMLAMLAGAFYGFSLVKNSFFPPSNTPMFYVDMWMPEGTDIRETYKEVQQVEGYLLEKDQVEFVTSTTGQGLQRFSLTYSPEKSYEAFAQLQVRVNDREQMLDLMRDLDVSLRDKFKRVSFQFRLMDIGPSPASKIEARIIGPDPQVLRDLAVQVEDIIGADPGARNIRHDWRERTKDLLPQFNESQARRLGISKQDLADTLQMAFGGSAIGLFRDGTEMLPIVVRLPVDERVDFSTVQNLKLWSPALQTYVPIQQVVDDISLDWVEPLIQRQDRKRTLTVLADHDILGDETAASLFGRVRPKVEAIDLPVGYSLEWGGEYESSKDAQESLFSSLPMGYLFMFIITVFLFNSIRQPIVIWLTVPLAVIGVAVGLLSTNSAFSFTALLGVLSLSGMVLKNGIVLMDQINLETHSGKDPYQAVVDSAISRVRPVSMAALTTILGMIPLVFDAFFGSMAVTIMFGLGFATVLTLVIVPVLYALFYRIKPSVNPA
ncbi:MULTISPECIES: efflux RND transporter permease subunit [unclassified Agarivorans]|uniref:efflux RND transporter permease subunit n=1 Tax=unclassified Agarivorans TaxID=2636026 RepID=UPI0026E2E999|nr:MULTISPECIES: efflux RND transporter permease subunit [unclassified Agarivorans]MDO6685196.1 efflux RND transporter permease subunit [Agarivorans sp. 3_MG-2023]MDO6715632.1 efflux RND transporter permease subunit [Agarivorans sp. 2_MG-2023]